MNFREIKLTVTEFVQENICKEFKLVKLVTEGEKWVATVEIIEESDYFRKLGKTDLIGLYRIDVSFNGEITGYERMLLRERSDLNWSGV